MKQPASLFVFQSCEDYYYSLLLLFNIFTSLSHIPDYLRIWIIVIDCCHIVLLTKKKKNPIRLSICYQAKLNFILCEISDIVSFFSCVTHLLKVTRYFFSFHYSFYSWYFLGKMILIIFKGKVLRISLLRI